MFAVSLRRLALAAGAVALRLLEELGVRAVAHVVRLGGVAVKAPVPSFDQLLKRSMASEVRCHDAAASQAMIRRIKKAKAEGVSVTDAEAVAGMRAAFTHLKLVCEPSGAIALGAVLAGKLGPTPGTVGVLEALSTKAANLSVLDTISGSLSYPQLTTGALTNMSLTLSSNAKGASGSVTLGFTIANPIPAAGSIIITMPSGYAGSASTGVQAGTLIPSASLCSPACTASISGQAITVVIGSTTIARGTSVTLTLTNVTNPSSATAGSAFMVRTTTAPVVLRADLNGDGTTSSPDLAVLLNAWGACN